MPERKKKVRRRSKRFKTTFFSAYRQEILIGVIFLMGIFLIVEDMDIKVIVYNSIVSAAQGINRLFNKGLQGIIHFFTSVESSDIVGYILIFVAFLLYVYALRNRTIERYSELYECPECGSDLNRVHRTTFQKSAGAILRLKIRRYRCKSCDFDGLHIRRMHTPN